MIRQALLSLLTLSLVFGQEQAIRDQIKTLRKVPDEQRGAVTRDLASQIQALAPSAAKLNLALGLAGLSTEGDFGRDTLRAVAGTLAAAASEQSSVPDEVYSELAQLARYEGIEVDVKAPQYAAAMKRLELDDAARQAANFTLTDLAGQQYTLKDLKGKVVLLNFWATWCPPCRKEMPDLEALYQKFKDQGLIILAISDEDIAKVQPFLAQRNFTYPVLLDPGRKVNSLFHVEGIPKNFVFDRGGKLVAQSIDMRTMGQFLQMLAAAGLK